MGRQRGAMGRAARARQQLEKASDLDGPAETDADKAAAAPGADVNGNGDEPWWKYWGMNSNSGRMPGSMPDTSAGSTSEATGKSDEGLSPGRPIPAWGAWGERPVEGHSPGGSKPIQMHVNDFFKSAGDGLNAAGKSTGDFFDFFKDLGENTVKIGENTVKTMADLPSNTVKTLEVLTTTSLSPCEPTTPTNGTAKATAQTQRAGPPADTNGGGTRMPGTMPDHAYAITRTPSSPADFFPKPKPYKPNTTPEKPLEPTSPSVATEKPNEGLSPGGRPLQMQMDDFFKSAGDGLNAAGKSTGDFLKDLGENTVKIGENTVKTIAESGEAIGKVALAPVKLFDSKVLGRRSPKRARSFRKAAVEQAALEKATREAFSTREAERLQPRDLVATARARRTGAMLMAWQAQAGFGARSTAARGFAALLLGLMLLAIGIVEFDGITLPVVAFDLFATLRWPRMLAIYRL